MRRRQLAKTSARGYGNKHQALRRSWAPKVKRGGVICWRCGRPIDPAEPWDLGHDDSDPTRRTYAGPEHVACNRATAGRQARKRSGRRARWW